MDTTQSGGWNDGAPHPADEAATVAVVRTTDASINSRPAIAPGETSSSAIAAREKAAVEARFLMALHRPRDFEAARRRLLDACKRPGFADAARYAKPVGKEKVTGLSIRFAEESRVLWGNMDVTTLLVFNDDETRIYRVQGTDLETNATESIDVMVEKFVERRSPQKGADVISSRQNKQGDTVYKIRATEDDLIVKVNANIAKARRNVILALIPADVKDECEDQCIATLKNQDSNDPTAARKRVLDSFWKYGVTPAQIVELLGHPIEQMNPAELAQLRAYYTAIKEGEATWPDIVDAHGATPATAKAAEPTKGTNGLKSALGKRAATAPETPAAAPTPAPRPAMDGRTCVDCGGKDGNHTNACPYSEEVD